MTQANTEVVLPEEFEDLVETDGQGFAKENAVVNVPVPSPHARPVHLNPMTNGPFLDEVEEVQLQEARDGRYRSERLKKRADKAKGSGPVAETPAQEVVETSGGNGNQNANGSANQKAPAKKAQKAKA